MEERSKTMDEIICTDAIEMSYVFYLYIIKYALLHFCLYHLQRCGVLIRDWK
jgi:hypothetical protein